MEQSKYPYCNMEKEQLIEKIQTIIFAYKERTIELIYNPWITSCPDYGKVLERNILLYSKDYLIDVICLQFSGLIFKKIAQERLYNLQKEDLIIPILLILQNKLTEDTFSKSIYGTNDEKLEVLSNNLKNYNFDQLHYILDILERNIKVTLDKL